MTREEFDTRYEDFIDWMDAHNWDYHSCTEIGYHISSIAHDYYKNEFRFNNVGRWVYIEICKNKLWEYDDTFYLRMILVQMFYEVSVQEKWYLEY